MGFRKFLQSFLSGSKRPAANDVAAAAARSMQLDILPATAQQLARKSVLLKRTGADLAAVGVAMVVSPPSGPYRHWISVDSRYLPNDFGLSGVLSVYTNEENCASGVTVFSSTAALAADKGGCFSPTSSVRFRHRTQAPICRARRIPNSGCISAQFTKAKT